MTHPLSDHVRADEKEKRLDSLEQRTLEMENVLLRAQMTALEKRVKELEASLKDSNEECNKLKQTVAYIKISDKEVVPSNDNDKNDDAFNSEISSDLTSCINKEEEIIYERILKLVENMKSDCQKAINMKIPTESQLPMRQGSMKSYSSKSPSPTDGLISPSKMIGGSWSPTSRSGTPGATSPSNTSQIPTKSPGSPNKASHLPSRSSTTPTPSVNSIPLTSLNKKQRQRTGSCCSSIPSRQNTPPPSNIHHNIATGIPSGISRMQYTSRRPVAC